MRNLIATLAVAVTALAFPAGQTPVGTAVEYRLSFPEPEHRWMQVEAVFPALPTAPLQVRMSRTSPGRYALHEFAKNVFEMRAFDGAGAPLDVARPNLHQWDVGGHDGTVRIVYKIFGDRIDGTYLSIDETPSPKPTGSRATSSASSASRFRSLASFLASTTASTPFSRTTSRMPAATAWSTGTARC